jgi:glucose-1-phosphate thymidylyltransferase
VKGILLAGGSGTRLGPLTRATSKQLLPVYDKPMVYYPLSVLMLAGIREVLVISTPRDTPIIEGLLGDGHALGMDIQYAVQHQPRGIAEALVLAADFVGSDSVSLVLGDNLFFGAGLSQMLQAAVRDNQGAVVFGHRVQDPERYGVAEVGADGRLVGVEEKPKHPKSNLAVVGLYVYDNAAIGIAKALTPSARGELEITDVNAAYIAQGRARLVEMNRGMAWLDMGTPDSLLEASQFVATLQRRQGLHIAAIEEAAFRMGFIDREQLRGLAAALGNSTYAASLRAVVEEVAPLPASTL